MVSRDNSTSQSDLPSRERVANALRRRIRSGDLEPGTRLPTQQDLVREFGVKRGVVRQALGILKDEGFLTDTGRGSPATAADPTAGHPAHEPPRTAGMELADRLMLAFRGGDHVTIDVFALTTETLSFALAQPLIAVTGGELSPQSITVRALLPNARASLALPRLVKAPDDDRPMERLHDLTRTYATALSHSLSTLVERELVPQISMTIRTVAITPTHQLYVLNGTEALVGYYHVVERPVEYGRESMEMYDVLEGLDTRLYRYSSAEDSRDEQETSFVEESRLWFESLWSTIARPAQMA